MKLVATRKEDQNQAVLDPWSAVHLGVGLATGLMMIPIRWVLAVSVGYELVEQYVERQRWGQGLFQTSGPESLGNAAVDVVLLALGHHLGTRWNATGAPAHVAAR